MITLETLQQKKLSQQKFACLTAYDAIFSAIINRVGIEVILVGDSLGQVIQGHSNPIPVSVEDICYHLRGVVRQNTHSLLMADLPFMSYATLDLALQNATRLMQAGTHVIKMEGGEWLAETIFQLTTRGIPVCAHIGLMPQSFHVLGGFKVQGREQESATRIFKEAQTLSEAGARLIVLECIPQQLAKEITDTISIPTIGIGAGRFCDAQIQVLYDMLGIYLHKKPKLAKNFLQQVQGIEEAISAYYQAVITGQFPTEEQVYL